MSTETVRPAAPTFHLDLAGINDTRLTRTRDVIAIIRDLLLIGFMVATLIMAGLVVSRLGAAGGTGGGDIVIPDTMPAAPACTVDDPCPELTGEG